VGHVTSPSVPYEGNVQLRANQTAQVFGPPPNETEAVVLSTARALTDNITDPDLLDVAMSRAVTMLTENKLVAEVSRNALTVLVSFKSGSTAFLFGALATPRSQTLSQRAIRPNLNVFSVQPAQGRAAAVVTPFQWQNSGDPSYTIFSNYIANRLGSTYSSQVYVPNDYVTLDMVANLFLGYYIDDYSWIIKDNSISHVSYGLFSWAGHGGYGNGVTIFSTGECYPYSTALCDAPPQYPSRGAAQADYSAYYNHDASSVMVGQASGDSKYRIAITSSFVLDYMYPADYPQSHSLFFADTCDGLMGTDMAQIMASRGVYTYLGWTGEVTIVNPANPSLDSFFNSLTSGKTAAQSYQDVRNALKDYDWATGAHLYYYPGPDTMGSPWYSSGDHGGWTVYWPSVYVSVTVYSVDLRFKGQDPAALTDLNGWVFNNYGNQASLTTYSFGVPANTQLTFSVSSSPSGWSFANWWDDYGVGQVNSQSLTINVGTSNHKIAAFFYIPAYSATFAESGISSGTSWGVTVGGTRYTSTGSSIPVSGLVGTVGYSYDSTVPGASGVQYVCTSGCSGSVSSSTTVTANYAILITTTVTLTQTSTSYSYLTTTTTSTSYTSTTTSTSTIPTVTTVVLVPLTITSTEQSTQFLTSFLTTTTTSYTDTATLTSTISTTVALVASTVTSIVQSVQYLTSILSTTTTSYTGTQTSTSTVVVPTTVVLVPLTATSTIQSTQSLSSTATTTMTSYTSTVTLTSTVPTVTTVVLLPTTTTSTVQDTQLLTSTLTTTTTSYTTTTTSTSTSVLYTTVTVSKGAAGSAGSIPLTYFSFFSLLTITIGHKVVANRPKKSPKARSATLPHRLPVRRT